MAFLTFLTSPTCDNTMKTKLPGAIETIKAHKLFSFNRTMILGCNPVGVKLQEDISSPMDLILSSTSSFLVSSCMNFLKKNRRVHKDTAEERIVFYFSADASNKVFGLTPDITVLLKLKHFESFCSAWFSLVWILDN